MDLDFKIDDEFKILAEIKSRISGDPLCKRSGCNGTGVRGIQVVIKDGKKKPQLFTCSCAKYGDTEYKRLYDEISLVDLQMRNFFVYLDKYLLKPHRATPFGFIAWKISKGWGVIRRLWHKLFPEGGIVP